MLICVDLDGTLLDTVPANVASYRAALEELGFTVTDEYYAERCNGGHYTRFLPPLMGGTPSTADVERVHDRKKALYSDFLDVVRPNTALMEILRTMQAAGHDLACVTTGSKQNATEVLEHFGVRELFGLIVTGEDVEKQKPDPEGYCKAMAHFRVTPAETMIFEDSGIGLEAAKASGATGFRVEQFSGNTAQFPPCGLSTAPAAAERPGKAPPLSLGTSPGGRQGRRHLQQKTALEELILKGCWVIWGNYLFSGRTISRMTLTMFSAERP